MVGYELYTCFTLLFSIGISIDIFVYTHILFPIYVCFIISIISIYIGILFHIHIYDFHVLVLQWVYIFKAQN